MDTLQARSDSRAAIELPGKMGQMSHCNDAPDRRPPKVLSLRTYFLIAVMSCTGPLGNVLLGKGMKQLGSIAIWPPANVLQTGFRIFESRSIWLGIASLITFFVSYMLVLSMADYSYVQPASSLAYGVVALLGYWVLGEHISRLRGAGIAVICLGVFIVGRTNPRTAEQP
jgi:drug/metabolite transporter (DMT)-like permease